MSTRFLLWYRPDITAAVLRATLVSALLTCGGMTLFGIGLWSPRASADLRPFMLIVGGIATLAGPISLMWRLGRLVIKDDVFVGVTTGGLDVCLGGRERRVSWDELRRVVLSDNLIVLELTGGERLAIDHDFDGATRAEVARELERRRQRAGLGLERP